VVAFQAWRDWWEDFKADHYAKIKREDSGEISSKASEDADTAPSDA
jgi:hypothetical protein